MRKPYTAIAARTTSRKKDVPAYQAEESAVSRLYGGIHWNFDNNVGLTAGTALGQYVVANFLRPVERGPAAGVVNGELIVLGSDGRDVLHVDRTGGELVVWANGKRLGGFDGAVAGIVVDGRDGDDLILISQQIDTDAEIYGGWMVVGFTAMAAGSLLSGSLLHGADLTSILLGGTALAVVVAAYVVALPLHPRPRPAGGTA